MGSFRGKFKDSMGVICYFQSRLWFWCAGAEETAVITGLEPLEQSLCSAGTPDTSWLELRNYQ